MIADIHHSCLREEEQIEAEAEAEAEAAVEAQDDDDEEGAAEEVPAEMDMQHYDDADGDNLLEGLDNDDEEVDDAVEGNLASGMMELEIFEQGGGRALALDPQANAGSDDEVEDDAIQPTDSILCLAMTEDDYSHLEVQVLTADGSLYTHHDILLPDFPLCLAWLDCPPFTADGAQQTVGNYIAVGTFSPAIELWNLDVLDPIEPSAVLGGEDPNAPKKSKKSKKSSGGVTLLPGSHSSSVLSLSWNTVYRQALASGGADNTVKVWDVTSQTCSYTFVHHTDKVQSVSWHPTEAWLLAAGSFDRNVSLIDCRTAGTSIACTLPSDVESLTWDPFHQHCLYCSTEDGKFVFIP